MTDNAALTDSTSPQRDTSVTRINSPAWLWIGRAVFCVLVIVAIVFMGQVAFVAFDYYRDLAAEQLAGTGVLAELYPWVMVIVRLIIHTIFVLVGSFIFWRRSHDRVGLLAAFVLITFGTGALEFYFALPNMTPYLIEHNLLWGVYLLSPTGWTLAIVMWHIFPDGHFVPRWMRYFSFLSVIPVIPWNVPSDSPIYAYNFPPSIFAGLLVALVLGYANFYRYRHVATPSQRQQIKWLVFGLFSFVGIYFSILMLPIFLPHTFPLGSVGFHTLFLVGQFVTLVIPIAFVFSIMRYRLWDIDLVINRSLVYGALAIVVALVFAMLLFGLQLVTGQTQLLLVLLISGALTPVIFAVLRSHVQHAVDLYVFNLRFDLDEVSHAQKAVEIKNPGALTGRKLGKYEVRDLIGKGGMGEVYRAVDNTETVAIKTLLSDVTANDESLERFQREAQVGMSLQHPNIAHVRSIDSQDGLIYMVMDYLEGKDLSRLLKDQGKLGSEEVIDIVTKLADALAAAHNSGLVHRDIKPSNLMLVDSGDHETHRVVLMDFGVTKMKGARSLTDANVIGTIDYMAPEQILKAREVDHRADIYSVGIMMYEMLIGECPFTGNVGQVLFAHIQQPAPDPREADRDVSRPLAKAIMKALEKNPDDRFQSVGDLSFALHVVAAPDDNVM